MFRVSKRDNILLVLAKGYSMRYVQVPSNINIHEFYNVITTWNAGLLLIFCYYHCRTEGFTGRPSTADERSSNTRPQACQC